MDNLLTPTRPYTPLPSPDNNNNPVIQNPPILTKKRILIGCLIALSLVLILIISIRLVLSRKSSTIYDTTTTRTTIQNQTPSRTTIPNQTPTSKINVFL
jgi:hypothetical protein